MQNVFSKNKVTNGIQMHATPDGRQRYYQNNKSFFISYNIDIKKDDYTLFGFYSYAVLNMYGETLFSGFCPSNNGKLGISTKRKDARYLVVSGAISGASKAMVLDENSDNVPDDQPYIGPDDDGGDDGGKTVVDTIGSVISKNFPYDETLNAYIVKSYSPNIQSYDKLSSAFTLYLDDADHIKANSSISVFGNLFKVKHINGEDLIHDLNSVPNVLPLLMDKQTFEARMMYSYMATSQTGWGVEDVFIDIDENSEG